MNYYSLNKIQGISNILRPLLENRQRKIGAKKYTVFLSHSHEDSDIVVEIINFLLTIDIYVYVDWLDPSMPTVTSGETATRIKEKISECDKFVVLLTEKSKDSRWVPWELGIADTVKGVKNIGILPVKRYSTTSDSTFEGIEYISIYPIISEAISKDRTILAPAIFPPQLLSGSPVWLKEGWIRKQNVNF